MSKEEMIKEGRWDYWMEQVGKNWGFPEYIIVWLATIDTNFKSVKDE